MRRDGETSLTCENSQVLQSLHYCSMPNAIVAMHVYFIICTKKICINQYLRTVASDSVCSALKLSVQVPCIYIWSSEVSNNFLSDTCAHFQPVFPTAVINDYFFIDQYGSVAIHCVAGTYRCKNFLCRNSEITIETARIWFGLINGCVLYLQLVLCQ